ncbi:MAG: ABC transporter ATP-binding protein/permease [Verrucomicrobiota bacterium]|nr:ABC transporter ATP-binding protein/permease [Verrucomicrobiota bacterium]
MSIYRRVFRYYRPFLPQTVAGLLLSLIGIGLNLLKPWPLKIIVDNVIPKFSLGAHVRFPGFEANWIHDPKTLVLVLCLGLIVIQFLWGLINWATNYILVKVGLQALLKLRTDLYAYLQSLSLKYHDVRRSSDSSFRVAYDSQSIQTIYNKGFTGIFGSVVTLIGTFMIMVRLDWQLTLLSLGIVPLIIAAIYFFAHRIRRESTFIQEQESAVLAQAQEGLSSIRMVHAFGREEFEVLQFHQQARQSLEANLRLTLTNINSALVISTLMVFGTSAMYYVGTLHVLAGTLTLGTLLVFSAYLLMLYQPLESITYTAWAMEGATAGAKRCFEVLNREDDVVDSPNAVAIESAKGAIGFQKVTFGYAQDRQVLHNVDLRIEPNQMIAIVGGTGAGKSTLLSLVPRFYDPTSGSVTLDGHDVREIKKRSLRAQIGIVLQDTLLFSTTIRENIAYGRSDATDDEIIDAARRAQADEFIRQLPNGYSSTAGERGGQLSVGQRQRIGIARAFLKNATVLLLDEPTSALDPTTEAAIMETIKDLMRGRTTLIATHRLATIHDVDRIVVLERGRMVEEGRGSELLARGGVYAKLFASGKFPT